jgi:NADH:ubiquinone reductase (non-electrogenic)
VTIVSPRPFFFYTPLLVGSTTGVVNPGSIIEPIRDVAPSVEFLRTACKDIDLQSKQVFCDDNVTLDYDHLVVAVGAQPNTFGIPGVEQHGKFLKEIEQGREVRKDLLNVIDQADVARAAGDIAKVKQLLNFVVVGGGPTGVEFCGELSDFVKQDLMKRYPKIAEHFKVTLVEALPGLLTMFHKSVGSYVAEHLQGQGVDIKLNAMVKGVEPNRVNLKMKDGTVEAQDFGILIWVAGVGMRPFTKALCDKIGKEKGQTDRRGLLVDECLRVKGTTPGEVFAIGDCAVSGKPPTAQVAYQQGKFLGRMFRAGAQHYIIDPEAPKFEYNHQGTMAYIGEGQGAAEIDPGSIIKLGRSSITDHIWWRSLYGEDANVRFMGPLGFAIWRSVYFSKLFSTRNRWCVASDWMRTGFFGRPAASSAQGTLVPDAH